MLAAVIAHLRLVNDKSFCGDVLGLCADVLLLVPLLGDMLDNLKSTACDIKVECAEPA